jgi:hypothetical protein
VSVRCPSPLCSSRLPGLRPIYFSILHFSCWMSRNVTSVPAFALFGNSLGGVWQVAIPKRGAQLVMMVAEALALLGGSQPRESQ